MTYRLPSVLRSSSLSLFHLSQLHILIITSACMASCHHYYCRQYQHSKKDAATTPGPSRPLYPHSWSPASLPALHSVLTKPKQSIASIILSSDVPRTDFYLSIISQFGSTVSRFSMLTIIEPLVCCAAVIRLICPMRIYSAFVFLMSHVDEEDSSQVHCHGTRGIYIHRHAVDPDDHQFEETQRSLKSRVSSSGSMLYVTTILFGVCGVRSTWFDIKPGVYTLGVFFFAR